MSSCLVKHLDQFACVLAGFFSLNQLFAQECQCSMDHTVSCNATGGRCQCMSGWTSETCSDDIDECLSQDACNATTETCINTEGSYTCSCKNGFLRNEDKICEGL